MRCEFDAAGIEKIPGKSLRESYATDGFVHIAVFGNRDPQSLHASKGFERTVCDKYLTSPNRWSYVDEPPTCIACIGG